MTTPRIALVTGGSRGIGAAIVRHLAAEGLAVVLGFGADAAAAEEVCRGVTVQGGSALAVQADLADPDQVATLVEQTVAAHGRLDVLVNCAAVIEGRPLAEVDAAHIDALFAVNVRGLLLACKHAAAAMTEGGSIVNISSINARGPVPQAPVYSATKAAVEALTKALARDLGPRGIRVNALAPGLILTERNQARVTEAVHTRFVTATPLGRLGTPEEIAAAVAFLASPAAGWITGEILAATGGYGL